MKKPEFNRDPLFHFGIPVPLKRPVMTAVPSILVRKLQPQDMFLIFATDGLWEHLTDEAAVKIVSKNSRVVSTKYILDHDQIFHKICSCYIIILIDKILIVA